MNRRVLLAVCAAPLIGGCGPVAVDEMGYRQRGVAEFQVGHVAEAKVLLERTLQANPRDPVTLYYLGRIAYQEGKWEEAIYRFQCCLSADPSHAGARDWLLRAERAAGAAGEKLRFIPLPPARRGPVRPARQREFEDTLQGKANP